MTFARALSTVAIGALLSAPAAAVTLTRGPYLQLLTTSSVTVVWRTDEAAPCSLSIQPIEGTARTVSGPTGTTCAVEVRDLDPGTRYSYVPRADGVPLGEASIFRTDDPAAPFVLLVVGDSGDGGPDQLAVRDRLLATPADLILHTGDMIYPNGEPENFDPRFFVPYRDLLRRVAFWPCLGNHDVRTDGGAPWRAVFHTPANNPAGDEGYYSFDHGNAHVVVLDSNAATAPGSAQHTFLERDLAASRARWKLVAFHHPIYSSSHHGSALDIRRNLIPVFDAQRVDLVLMGHDHVYERTKPLRADREVEPGTGTVYVTTGGGGRKLYAAGRSSFTAYTESAFHLTRLTVAADALRIEMIRADGAVRDTATLTKPATP
jgi:hypothetical protein